MANIGLSVTVTLWYCIETNAHIVELFPLFTPLPPLQNSKGTSSAER